MWTEKCIRCLKPATVWSGYVKTPVNGYSISAGFCDNCYSIRAYVSHPNPWGEWKEEYGVYIHLAHRIHRKCLCVTSGHTDF
jgi:hypothetical protein